MAIYPVAWQARCDSCGSTANGAVGTSAQEMFVALVQQGWLLHVQTAAIPPTVLLCSTCAPAVVAAQKSGANGGAAAAESAPTEHEILEHAHGEDS